MQGFKVKQLNQQRGISLIEVMLAFAIIASIVVMALNQYNVFNNDKDAQQVNYNVDLLAQAAANYYWANCRGQYDPTTKKIIPGKLSPYNATPPVPGTPVLIDVTADLVNTGLLQSAPSTANNHYVTSYIVQFNETLIPQSRMACDDADCNTSKLKQIGTLVSFDIQISAKIRDTTKSAAYKNLLGANCVSSLSGTTVLPCTPPPPAAAKTYVVFIRKPALPTPSANAPLDSERANLQSFSQQQTVNPIGNLIAGDHTTEYQYFLCNGY